jgi:8-oxo-dGTP pyrophosphatase MutT (NUDIX family)
MYKLITDLEQSLLSANERKYSEARNPLKSHGPDHHWRVYQYAVKLADKLGVSYDPEILAGAALLHDMAAYYPDETKDEYHKFDHKFAEDVLRETNFPVDKIPAVAYAIANHGSDPSYKKTDEPIEVTLLRDADKMDVFGPVGVARIVMVRTLKGDDLNDIVADFYTGGHLKCKWESITTQEARDLVEDDYNYALDFFERLDRSLRHNSPQPDEKDIKHHFAAIFLLTNNSRVIGQQRDNKPNIDHPGKVGVFGGTVEAGEDPLDAAWRELVGEETNLKIEKTAIRPFSQDVSWRELTQEWQVRHFFYVRIAEEQLANMQVYEGQGWAEINGADDPCLIDVLRPVVKAFFERKDLLE